MVFWLSHTRWGQGMLGIPYRIDNVHRSRRQQASSLSLPLPSETHAHLRILLSETGLSPSMVLDRRSSWSVATKLIAGAAAIVLLAGVILTILAVNSDTANLVWNMDTYRPIIFTILGVLFIVIGPVVACRMVLNAYDRRLAAEQRQYEHIARNMRRVAEHEPASRSRNRAQMAVDYLLVAAGLRSNPSPPRDISNCFPGVLPSYASALDLQEHKHWSTKFFDYKRDPPPPYGEALQMQTFRFEERLLPSSANGRPADDDSNSEEHDSRVGDGANSSIALTGPPAYSQTVDVQVLPVPQHSPPPFMEEGEEVQSTCTTPTLAVEEVVGNDTAIEGNQQNQTLSV